MCRRSLAFSVSNKFLQYYLVPFYTPGISMDSIYMTKSLTLEYHVFGSAARNQNPKRERYVSACLFGGSGF
jgi:hypothetical protein